MNIEWVIIGYTSYGIAPCSAGCFTVWVLRSGMLKPIGNTQPDRASAEQLCRQLAAA